MDVKKLFGMSVKNQRTLLGLSQGALAQRANLHRTYITDIERGTRNLTLENISKLAGAFGLPIGRFFPAGAPVSSVNGNATLPAGRNEIVDILIVEDDHRDIQLALNAFKQARMTNPVYVVQDGEAALDFIYGRGAYAQRVTEGMLGAVLLDLKLPKIHGLEVLRRIKSDVRSRHIEVIVLTGSPTGENIAEAIRLGAAGCITKPVNFQNFSQLTPKMDFCWTLHSPTGNPKAAVSARHTPEAKYQSQYGTRPSMRNDVRLQLSFNRAGFGLYARFPSSFDRSGGPRLRGGFESPNFERSAHEIHHSSERNRIGGDFQPFLGSGRPERQQGFHPRHLAACPDGPYRDGPGVPVAIHEPATGPRAIARRAPATGKTGPRRRRTRPRKVAPSECQTPARRQTQDAGEQGEAIFQEAIAPEGLRGIEERICYCS